MIGSRNMEQGILGQYANYVRQLHLRPRFPGSTWLKVYSRTPRVSGRKWAMRGSSEIKPEQGK